MELNGQESETIVKNRLRIFVRASGTPRSRIRKTHQKIDCENCSRFWDRSTIRKNPKNIDCENCSRFWDPQSKIRKDRQKTTAEFVRASRTPDRKLEKLKKLRRTLFAHMRPLVKNPKKSDFKNKIRKLQNQIQLKTLRK